MQIEFGHLEPAGHFIRLQTTPDQITRLAFEHGNIDCFASVLEYADIDNSSSLIWGPFVLDLDNHIETEEDFNDIRLEALASISYMKVALCVPKHLIRCYFSGAKGFHICAPATVWFDEPIPHMHLKYKALATDIKTKCNLRMVDMTLYDWRHLLRLQNTINSKTGLYKIELTHEELRHISLDDLLRLASQPRDPIKAVVHVSSPSLMARAMMQSAVALTKKLEDRTQYKQRPNMLCKALSSLSTDPPCVSNILDSPRTAGSRNIVVCLLASYYGQRGMVVDDATEKIWTWNLACCCPPLPKREVAGTVQSIYKGAHRYQYGCTSFSEYGGCSDSCPLKTKHSSNKKMYR